MSLITDDFADEIGYDNLDIEQVMYIDENWKIELGPFNQEIADKAVYILVSDDFPLEKFLIPKREFRLLIHTRTIHDARVAPLLKKFPVLLIKTIKEREEEDSKYDEIAQMILENN